jgi:hypothetical protein
MLNDLSNSSKLSAMSLWNLLHQPRVIALALTSQNLNASQKQTEL